MTSRNIKYKRDYRKEVFELFQEIFLWYELDYDASVIGSSTPAGRAYDIIKANQRLRENGKIDVETERNLDSQLENIINILREGGLNPDLNSLKELSRKLIFDYISLGLVSNEKYEKTINDIMKTKESFKKLPKK